MIAKATYNSIQDFFLCRIYRILMAVLLVCAFEEKILSQEIGSFKTVQSGDYSVLSTWNTFTGSSWIPAISKPNSTTDIYIDQTHTLRLVGNEKVKSVFINAETGASQKLNLNGYQLEVYGSLNAFSGAAPGTPSGTWNSQNWIGNSINSKIIFRGSSRTIIPKNSWSGFSTNSRYAVEFDPGSGVLLQIEEPFKALKFTIKSGTVVQTLDTSVIPNSCSTFSFNNETSYGASNFGDFVIESGGTLLSKCNSSILFRSGTNSASLFDLQDGGQLILEGISPQIEASNLLLNGKLIYRNIVSAQNFLSKSYLTSITPTSIHDLELQGTQNLSFPTYLNISGDLTKIGSGNFLLASTRLEFSGAEDQDVVGFGLAVGNLTCNKSDGNIKFEQDVSVLNELELISGVLDLRGNDLNINTSLTSQLSYSGGSWKNVGLFTYFGSPLLLNASNATFPFEDVYQGGIRKVQLLGLSAGGNLQISFTEYKGAEYNSSFSDNDGTAILYRLFSYFQFSGLNLSTNLLELRISADKLIVDQVDDLRIVGTGYAAPGSHLPGLDPIELWARRNLTFNDLAKINFTVGSYRTLSVLPITWLETRAIYLGPHAKIYWKATGIMPKSSFEIYRFESLKEEKILLGVLNNEEIENELGLFEFEDRNLPPLAEEIFYQIKFNDSDGSEKWSTVFRLEGKRNQELDYVIFPNPHLGIQDIQLHIPGNFHPQKIFVLDFQGKVIESFTYEKLEFSRKLSSLKPGIYLIQILESTNRKTLKFIKF